MMFRKQQEGKSGRTLQPRELDLRHVDPNKPFRAETEQKSDQAFAITKITVYFYATAPKGENISQLYQAPFQITLRGQFNFENKDEKLELLVTAQ